mmetsp:Transcript_105108/g.250223  ORF Transcript_105108/g.250223 Transcript_105108/m.250223 type:complete len:326 (-) Transcript_105108:684-1661(-)
MSCRKLEGCISRICFWDHAGFSRSTKSFFSKQPRPVFPYLLSSCFNAETESFMSSSLDSSGSFGLDSLLGTCDGFGPDTTHPHRLPCDLVASTRAAIASSFSFRHRSRDLLRPLPSSSSSFLPSRAGSTQTVATKSASDFSAGFVAMLAISLATSCAEFATSSSSPSSSSSSSAFGSRLGGGSSAASTFSGFSFTSLPSRLTWYFCWSSKKRTMLPCLPLFSGLETRPVKITLHPSRSRKDGPVTISSCSTGAFRAASAAIISSACLLIAAATSGSSLPGAMPAFSNIAEAPAAFIDRCLGTCGSPSATGFSFLQREATTLRPMK